MTELPWEPMKRLDNSPSFVRNPDLEEVNAHAGYRPADEIWMNNLYQCALRLMVPDGSDSPPPERRGMLHLSIHRHDRYPVGDWRHMQQIKNECAGPERIAVEIYPEESKLVDSANEYHLWVLEDGFIVPFAFSEGLVTTDEQVEKYNSHREEANGYKGRQRPWQKGLTTGRNEHTPLMDAKTEAELDQISGK